MDKSEKENKGNGESESKATALIGIIGSVVTILLTIWNTYTKSVIDAQEKGLQELEIRLKERAAGLEESRERVERYRWVLFRC
ncbi:hypothetical protein ACFQ4C_20195 [Larkinella insperata]|uniref:Uncharacterized protein n=1 Tax=Larkinella insperata TaxID=332158 RepID=A0ABW3QKQ3_9BACT|nr:hypothetical protein [Larkinella insperata]